MFSHTLLSAIETEAAALGLKGATAVTVALRTQLVERKARGGVSDGRVRPYYAAGRVIMHGVSTPMPGTVEIAGMESVSALAQAAAATVGKTLPDGCCSAQDNAARAGLTRTGKAHYTVALSPPATQPPNCWVDVWVFRTAAEAAAYAAKIPSGKLF